MPDYVFQYVEWLADQLIGSIGPLSNWLPELGNFFFRFWRGGSLLLAAWN